MAKQQHKHKKKRPSPSASKPTKATKEDEASQVTPTVAKNRKRPRADSSDPPPTPHNETKNTTAQQQTNKKQKSKKSNKKTTGWNALPWKTIDIQSRPQNSTLKEQAYNHYDDSNRANDEALSRDLYGREMTESMEDGEDGFGVLCGMEVVDGNAFLLEKKKRGESGGYYAQVVVKSVVPGVTEMDEKEDDNEEKHGDEDENENDGEEKKEDGVEEEDNKEESQISTGKNKKKSNKKKKPKKKTNKEKQSKNTQSQPPQDLPDEQSTLEIQSSWNAACNYSILLHHTLCQGLAVKQFAHPTQIQSMVLPAAMLGNRDVVGAAPTGSGKTLAYALPMLHAILTQKDQDQELKTQNNNNNNNLAQKQGSYRVLQGLVLCPTRELAMQVKDEIISVCLSQVKVVALVGGLARLKQARLLKRTRPEVIVATPGRMWDLLVSREFDHLQRLDELQFLVVDEADRMIGQGNFPQLRLICEFIDQHSASREEESARKTGFGDEESDEDSDNEESDDDTDNEESDSEDSAPMYNRDTEAEDVLESLPGLPGVADVTMLSDELLAKVEKQKQLPRPNLPDSAKYDGESLDENEGDVDNDEEEENVETKQEGEEQEGAAGEDEEQEADEQEGEEQEIDEQDDEQEDAVREVEEHEDEQDEESLPTSPRVTRQTFVFSATLTLPSLLDPSLHHNDESQESSNSPPELDGALAEILQVAKARNRVKIVDLSTTSTNSLALNPTSARTLKAGGVRLPPGLSLYQISCTQRHKDSHCFAFLVTTVQGSSGPSLVFCNSIAGVKRVGETLKWLGLPVRVLHAHLQQKSRLKVMEFLRNAAHGKRAVVVATDVAARGLDIPSVSTVIHYDVARNVDAFIHRSGRTARGVGEGAVGACVSLVSAEEEGKHRSICEAIFGGTKSSRGCASGFQPMPMDGNLLVAAQKRTVLAAKIVAFESAESKVRRDNKWFKDAAVEAGIDIDEDDAFLNGLAGETTPKERRLEREAAQAKNDLRHLLAQPMQKQRFGKFLSRPGVIASIKADSEVKSYIVPIRKQHNGQRGKKRKGGDGKKKGK